ncbi:MAG: PaaI family thioesterase [Frankia sp.]|nr:PaaI family thioesterase [Frankia sp.]
MTALREEQGGREGRNDRAGRDDREGHGDAAGYLRVPWAVLDDYRCFGCSPHNPHGLRLRFALRPDGLVTRFRLDRGHESYPGVVHGGLIGVICDETMGNLIVLRLGLTAFTTAMRVRYLSSLSVGAEYRCVARLRGGEGDVGGRSGAPAGIGGAAAAGPDGPIAAGTSSTGLVHAEAEVLDADGVLLATATATYRPTPLDSARERMNLPPADADRVARALAAALPTSLPTSPPGGSPASPPPGVPAAHRVDRPRVPHQEEP